MNRMTRVRYLSSYLEWVSPQDFKDIAYVGFFRHFVCVFVFVSVIVYVFVFVSSYDFWIALIISFQNIYGYRRVWSLRAVIMINWSSSKCWRTDGQTKSPIPPIDSAHPKNRNKLLPNPSDLLACNVCQVHSCLHLRCNLLALATWKGLAVLTRTNNTADG